MKTKIFTLATILMLSFTMANASTKVKVLKIVINNSEEFYLPIKEEALIETFDFEASKYASSIKEKNTQKEWIDIRPFVKPEKELEEEF